MPSCRSTLLMCISTMDAKRHPPLRNQRKKLNGRRCFPRNRRTGEVYDPSRANPQIHSERSLSAQESDPDHRLPKLNYHTMKEKQIRELLSQAELSTSGDKNALMARHQQYIFLCSVYELLPTKHPSAGPCCITLTKTGRPIKGMIWNSLGRN